MSAVIGVVLVVAIAVVIAAIVFVLAQRYTAGKGEAAPPFGVAKDENEDRLGIVRVQPELLLSQFKLSLSVDGDFALSEPIPGGPDALVANTLTPLGGAPGGPADGDVLGGTYLSFCSQGGPATDVTVLIMHVESNAVVYRGQFADLAQCP